MFCVSLGNQMFLKVTEVERKREIVFFLQTPKHVPKPTNDDDDDDDDDEEEEEEDDGDLSKYDIWNDDEEDDKADAKDDKVRKRKEKERN